MTLQEENEKQTAPQPEQSGLYTCVGKGGVYEKVASALGAGPLRGKRFIVYRSETDYFVREYEDFQDRMEPYVVRRT